jgi:CheY-like chemotaxis protein
MRATDSTLDFLFEGVNVRRNSAAVKRSGARLAAIKPTCPRRYASSARVDTISQLPIMVLIISADAIAAALLGALIETLGYSVRFASPPETADQTIRRVRPTVCLLDCDDPANCSDEFLGRAAMRRISIVVFGKREALDRVQALALEHDIEVLIVPPDIAVVDEALQRAMKKAG